MSHVEQAEVSKATDTASAGAAAEVHSRLFEDSYKMPSGGGSKGNSDGSQATGKAPDGSSNGAPGNRCLDIPPIGHSK
ncbi:hypothetical protein BH11CYA1_BH11CYA1_31240 [soil metagenome]